jgi:O-succinylbenzoate synthase
VDAVIRYAPYVLRARRALGVHAGERYGTLLQVETSDGIGYADLHPWPELGDEPLSRQLDLLRDGVTTRLSARSLALAAKDRSARAMGASAFAGLTLPENHYPLHSPVGAHAPIGFTHLKFKIGADLRAERSALEAFCDFRVRLDFNERLDPAGFREFMKGLDWIDFAEDPIPWGGWSEIQGLCPLAFDRQSSFVEPSEALFDYWIAKPALQDADQSRAIARQLGVRWLATSYLDHPVGQMTAALEAAGCQEVCGLASHFSYEPTPYSEALRMNGSRLLGPEGTGIGFDSLLAREDWRAL